MISHGFKRVFSLLLFAFWFWSVQGLAAQEINFGSQSPADERQLSYSGFYSS